MLIWHLPTRYVVGVAIWSVLMLGALVGLVMLRRAGKRRRGLVLATNAGLSLWLLLVFLTALELGFAVFYSESDALNFTNVARRWYAMHIAPQVNELGLRSRHSPAETLAAGPQHIAFVGDSFTFGHGVPRMADRFSDRIEAGLEVAHPGRYQVDNFGVPGEDVTAVAEQVKALLENGYRPDVVVYVWQVNDLERLDERTWAAANGLSGARSDSWLIRDTYFFNWLYYRIRLGSSAVSTYFDDLRAAYEGPAFARAADVLDGMRALCAAYGADLRLVVFPFVHELGDGYRFRSAHQHLADYAKERGMRLVDLEPVLSPHAAEGLIVNPRDTHPNERAHELAATAIRTGLLDDLFAPDGRR